MAWGLWSCLPLELHSIQLGLNSGLNAFEFVEAFEILEAFEIHYDKVSILYLYYPGYSKAAIEKDVPGHDHVSGSLQHAADNSKLAVATVLVGVLRWRVGTTLRQLTASQLPANPQSSKMSKVLLYNLPAFDRRTSLPRYVFFFLTVVSWQYSLCYRRVIKVSVSGNNTNLIGLMNVASLWPNLKGAADVEI